jgi:hypothetical protein
MGGFEFQRSVGQYLQTLPPPGTSKPDLIFTSPNLDSEQGAIAHGLDLWEAKGGSKHEGNHTKNTQQPTKKKWRMVVLNQTYLFDQITVAL